MLEKVRTPLLEEARRSPSLLADLAGLEEYVAESYESRSFVELLQNADDAGASRFTIRRVDSVLVVANDGRLFSQTDLESLCRSAASGKRRGVSIGYRGIGFKSVVGFARTIHLVSGGLAATFSRERTLNEIPDATRVPLVRVPHSLEPSDRSIFGATLDALLSDGFTTAFVFDGLLAGGIANEFASFDASSLLFLRNVEHVDLRTPDATRISVRRTRVNETTRAIELSGTGIDSRWIVREEKGVAVAFRREADRIVRLDERESLVHAFLPTLEPTGFAAKVHGDISTDPSRTRIVFDDRTGECLGVIAEVLVGLVEEAVSDATSPDSAAMLAAIVPFSDARIFGFQRRSFKSELFSMMQRVARGCFSNLRCRPTWLNALDFELLCRSSQVRGVLRDLDGIEGLHGLLCYLGAKDAAFDELSPGLRDSQLSVSGAAEVVSAFVQRFATNQVGVAQFDRTWRLWAVDDRLLSFDQVSTIQKRLDPGFADLLTERVSSAAECRRFVAALESPAVAATLLPMESTGRPTPSDAVATDVNPVRVALKGVALGQRLSLKRWRGAEQQVLNLLSAQGCTVDDVSRQNLGYDLVARPSDGEEVFIEVKSIDHPGQAFTMTSNEEAVARQHGAKYQIAIVRQVADVLEVAFIRNPIAALQLTRSCRQWVWECERYPYEPQRFLLE